MSKNVFLYKENSDDRDCVAYIEDINKEQRFACNHYFSGVTLHGSCYSGQEFAPYENVKTILTKDEYTALIDFDKQLHNLGYGITIGDERYQAGIALCEKCQYIFDKLHSKENEELYLEIQEEEKEYIMDEYNLSEEEVNEIFDEYSGDYRDRSIICSIYDDTDELGYEEALQLGYINDNDEIMSRYFDFRKFGEDLLEEESYHELSDGRIVYYMY